MSYNAKRLQLLEKCKKNTGAGPSVHEVVEASGEACGLSIHLATPKSKWMCTTQISGVSVGGKSCWHHQPCFSAAPGYAPWIPSWRSSMCLRSEDRWNYLCDFPPPREQQQSNPNIAKQRNHQLLAFCKYSVKMANCKLSFSGFVPPAAYFVQRHSMIFMARLQRWIPAAPTSGILWSRPSGRSGCPSIGSKPGTAGCASQGSQVDNRSSKPVILWYRLQLTLAGYLDSPFQTTST